MEIGSDVGVVVTTNDYKIKLINGHSAFWWKDLKITNNNKDVVIIDSLLDVNSNYLMLKMIDAYHAYVLYHDNLVKAVYNKPLTIASLNIVNDDEILTSIETLEKDLVLYRKQIISLENKIINEIKKYIEEKKLILQDNTFSYRFNKFFSMFKFSKYNNVLEQSLNVTYEQNKIRKD